MLPHMKYERKTMKNASVLSQRIHFNLIHHPWMVSNAPTIKLFKSFMTTLWNADMPLIVLPFQSSKQQYLSLSNIKQFQWRWSLSESILQTLLPKHSNTFSLDISTSLLLLHLRKSNHYPPLTNGLICTDISLNYAPVKQKRWPR